MGFVLRSGQTPLILNDKSFTSLNLFYRKLQIKQDKDTTSNKTEIAARMYNETQHFGSRYRRAKAKCCKTQVWIKIIDDPIYTAK